MNVSNKVIEQFYNSSNHKVIKIHFLDDDFVVAPEDINGDSLVLEEHLASSTFEFVGCVSNSFSIIIKDTTHELLNQRIQVSIWTDETADEPIPLFNGYVSDVEMQSNKKFKKITAYDIFSQWADSDCTEWYNSLNFPMTLKEFRTSFFLNSMLSQVEQDLPNDNIVIPAKMNITGLNRLRLCKSICQINGVFGLINRTGKMEYRLPKAKEPTITGLYPSFSTYPSDSTYPADNLVAMDVNDEETDIFIGYYKNINYEEYTVKPVDRIILSKGSNEEEVAFGDGDNTYTIKGNFFTKNADTATMLQMAQNIYDNVGDIEFVPFRAENVGLPFIECGVNSLTYYLKDFNTDSRITKTFLLLGRKLSGIQSLKDVYEAEGDEYQHVFVSEIKAYDDTITQNNVNNVVNTAVQESYTTEAFTQAVTNTVTKTHPIFKVVDEKPATFEAGTIYFVRK